MCFALREKKVAVTEEKCVKEHISLASLKEDILSKTSILCTIQVRSTRKTRTSIAVAVFTI